IREFHVTGVQTCALPISAGTVRFERKAPGFTENDATLDASILGGSAGRHAGNVDFAAGNASYYARLTANQDRAQDYKDGDGERRSEECREGKECRTAMTC